MDVTLNFLGVSVSDWRAAYRFYTDTLGIRTAGLNPDFGDWALLGGGWDAYHAGSRSLIFELFDLGRTMPGRAWGRGQGVRPAVHVVDLERVIAAVKARAVPLSSAVEATAWGQRVELTAAEGIRWALCHMPGQPALPGLDIPYIGHVEIKAHDLAAQRAFYVEVMGLRIEYEAAECVILGQKPGEPLIILEPGGQRTPPPPPTYGNVARAYPVFTSFMTPDIHAAAAHLDANHVTILKPVVRHDSWGGTDMIIADPDGNAVQIVQYGT